MSVAHVRNWVVCGWSVFRKRRTRRSGPWEPGVSLCLNAWHVSRSVGGEYGDFRTAPKIPGYWFAIWAAIGVAAAWFIYDSINYVASRDPQPGATFLNRQLWYLAHMAIAMPVLAIAPIQFIAHIRQARPQVHRWLGRTFLASSILAGLLAIWLGATIQYQGSRIPLVIFGALWIGFSAAAWVCASKRDFANHRKFVIRRFTIGLAFIWVRILGALDEQLFFFIESQEARDTTQEFLSFIIPLLVVEAWLSWVPSIQSALRRR